MQEEKDRYESREEYEENVRLALPYAWRVPKTDASSWSMPETPLFVFVFFFVVAVLVLTGTLTGAAPIAIAIFGGLLFLSVIFTYRRKRTAQPPEELDEPDQSSLPADVNLNEATQRLARSKFRWRR